MNDLLEFAKEVESFLGTEETRAMDTLGMNAQFNNHLSAGHIQLQFTPTEILDHLGAVPAGSLLEKGTDER